MHDTLSLQILMDYTVSSEAHGATWPCSLRAYPDIRPPRGGGDGHRTALHSRGWLIFNRQAAWLAQPDLFVLQPRWSLHAGRGDPVAGHAQRVTANGGDGPTCV